MFCYIQHVCNDANGSPNAACGLISLHTAHHRGQVPDGVQAGRQSAVAHSPGPRDSVHEDRLGGAFRAGALCVDGPSLQV